MSASTLDVILEKARKTRRSKSAKAKCGQADAKADILAAARKEFGTKGLAGARVDQIARRAKANKQLVYYYFGSKDGLYRAALEDTYAEIREEERKLDLRALPPAQAIERLIDFSLYYLASHREFITMLADENAHGARHARASKVVVQTNSPLIEVIGDTLRRGAREGIFRKDVDPIELYISIAGMSYFYFANRPTLSAIFGRDLSKPETLRAYRDHVVTLTLAGLAPDRGRRPSKRRAN